MYTYIKRQVFFLKFEHSILQLLWPFVFVSGYEHLFRGGCMGLLPVALHYNYSAGMHTVPVMKWVLLWVDLSMSSHYSVFLLLGTRAKWQRIAAALTAWHCDRKRGGQGEQPQNHRQQSDPSIVRLLECQKKWRITFQSPANKFVLI